MQLEKQYKDDIYEEQIDYLIERIMEAMEKLSEGRIAESDWEKVHTDLSPLLIKVLQDFKWPDIHESQNDSVLQ